MADDLKIRVPVELDLSNSLSNLKLNTPTVQAKIQTQLDEISKNLKLNIGQIDTSSLNAALSNVQNKVIGTNNGLTIKPVIDGKIIEDTDTLIKAVVGKLQQLNNVDLNGFKNNLKNLGFSGKDVTGAADELVQALKLTPENKSVIINSYQNLMDSIRNTIKSDSMVADKNFDNRLVMSIYQAISEYKNLEQTATSAMANVKNATETVVNTNTQVNNSAKYISTEYQTSFGAVSNVLQQARVEFERFGEVSVVSNKSVKAFDNAINRYKEMDNTIQDISNKFNQLKVVPNNATAQIEGLKSKLVELRNIEVSEGRTENWSQKYRELAIAVKEAETNVKKLQLAEKSDNSSAQQQSTYYNRIFENQKLIYNLKKQLLTANSEETTELNRQLTNAQKRISYSEEQLKKKQLESDELKRQKNELDNIYSAELKIANLSTKGNMLSGIDKTIAKLQSIPNQTAFLNNSQNSGVKQLQTDIQNIINKYNELRTKIQSLNGNNTNATANLRQEMLLLATEFDRVNTSAKNLKASMSSGNLMQRQAQQAELLVEKVKKLRSEIIAYQNANSKAMKSNRTGSNGITYSAEIDTMLAKLKNASSVTDAEFKKISASFRSLKAEIKSVGLEGGTVFSGLIANIKKFTSWMSMTFLISRFTMEVRQAVVELKEIDTVLTEISKTSDRTTESLEKLGKTSFDTASKYGQKASDYLLGVQEMSRAGFGETESENMAELSTLAQSAGDMTAKLANEYLIATNAAYKLNGSVNALTNVLDSQNYVTNRNAVNLTELANATKIAGSQSAVSAVGIDKMTAAVGTMIASTQEGGEVAGRAFKAILMNLQQVSAEADDIGDGGEAITSDSLTKYEKACADLGVSLKTVKDGALSLRDPMEILEELANSVSQEAEGSVKVANLINAVGGKYRGNQLISLLRNWDTYKKMLSEFNSDEAIGSAAEEAQKTAESWQGMLNALENDWSEFINTIVNSDIAKSIIESARRIIFSLSDSTSVLDKGISFLTKGEVSTSLEFVLKQIANLLELVTKLTDKIGLIPTILAGLSLKNVGELSLKYARSYATTDIKHRECNTF